MNSLSRFVNRGCSNGASSGWCARSITSSQTFGYDRLNNAIQKRHSSRDAPKISAKISTAAMAGRHLFHTSANRRKLDTDESAHTQPTNTQHPTTNTQHPTTEPTTTTTATTTATATETPDKTVPTQTAVQRIAQLDQKALELYEAHPLCFRNFPIDLINWRVTQRPVHGQMAASPLPSVHLGTQTSISFTHMTPWAVVGSSTVGLKGNMGSIDHKGNVVNFHKATQECVVTDKPLIPGQQPNALFDEYVTWLAAIEEKLLEHVIDNRNIYKKLAGDITEPNRQKAIELLRTRFKSPLHEQGGNQKVSFKAKLYQKRYKQKAERKEFACALDEELAASHNVQRTDIPVFEANGQLVPLEERVLRPDDVVSLQSRLFVLDDSTAVKKSFTLTRHLGSVVILRKGLHDYTKLLEMQRWRKVSALRTGVNKCTPVPSAVEIAALLWAVALLDCAFFIWST